MKQSYLSVLSIVLLLFTIPAVVLAQDDCNDAILITEIDGTCETYTNVGATNDIGVTGCMEGTRNVWFKFNAIVEGLRITVNDLQAAEIALVKFPGQACDPDILNAEHIACISCGVGFHCELDVLASELSSTGDTEEYYIMVTSMFEVQAAAFELCTDILEGQSVSTETLHASTGIQTYPMPVRNGKLTILQEDNKPSLKSIMLFNSLGQALPSVQLPDADAKEQMLDLSGMPTGVYYLQLNTSEGRHVEKLLVLE